MTTQIRWRMDQRTFKSLLAVLDWLALEGRDKPTEDISRVRSWAFHEVITKVDRPLVE